MASKWAGNQKAPALPKSGSNASSTGSSSVTGSTGAGATASGGASESKQHHISIVPLSAAKDDAVRYAKGTAAVKEGFVLFWGGWPSQWFKGEFVVEGQKYVTAEQYMMAEKARLFKDDAARKAILATDNAAKQKALGRGVKGFVDKVWFSNCDDIVYKGNLAKFSQQPNLKKLLLATGDKVIVEASPKDTVWGIGLAPDDDDCLDPAKWKGQNRLGKALMRVRDTLTGKSSAASPSSEGKDQDSEED